MSDYAHVSSNVHLPYPVTGKRANIKPEISEDESLHGSVITIGDFHLFIARVEDAAALLQAAYASFHRLAAKAKVDDYHARVKAGESPLDAAAASALDAGAAFKRGLAPLEAAVKRGL